MFIYLLKCLFICLLASCMLNYADRDSNYFYAILVLVENGMITKYQLKW